MTSSEFAQHQYARASAMGYHLDQIGESGFRVTWSREECVADLRSIEDVARWLDERETDEARSMKAWESESE